MSCAWHTRAWQAALEARKMLFIKFKAAGMESAAALVQSEVS
jgi:hypothetical protein